MYLQTLEIEGYKNFRDPFSITFSKDLNVLVGENATGKTAIVDAIRLLLLEDEFGRNLVSDADFHAPFSKPNKAAEFFQVHGVFDGLSREETVAFLPWLDENRQFAGLRKTTYPHFVGTFDSWLHRYVAHPFGYMVTGYSGRKIDSKHDRSIRLVDDTVSDGWIANYKCKTKSWYFPKGEATPRFMPLYADMLQYDVDKSCWEIRKGASGANEYITDKAYFDSKAFRHFRSENAWLTLQHLRDDFSQFKTAFLRDGFATYHDIERVAYQFLIEKEGAARRLSDRFPFIIVDECQDLSRIQLKILAVLQDAGTRLHFVGDTGQAIWEFRKVDPKNVRVFASERDFEHEELTDNFRSCQPIVSLSQKLIGGGQLCGKEATPKEPACICFLYGSMDDIPGLPARFEKFLRDKLKIDAAKSAILVRGKSMAYRLKALNRDKIRTPQIRFAMAVYLWNT